MSDIDPTINNCMMLAQNINDACRSKPPQEVRRILERRGVNTQEAQNRIKKVIDLVKKVKENERHNCCSSSKEQE